MHRLAWELILALIAILVIGAGYAVIATSHGIPGPSGLLGHSLGIAGFIMMLGAETLYTMRKRLRRFQYGPTATWLQAHIFLGLVGPFLVLLHSAGKFHGLAGALMILTLVMVASGFVGRYIYTAAPRSLDGDEIGADELESRFARTTKSVETLLATLPAASRSALEGDAIPAGWLVILTRPWLHWRQRRRVRYALQRLTQAPPKSTRVLERLLAERYALRLQIHALATTRRFLALWHLFHVPLGGVLFVLAFLHVGAALYYATLLR